MNNDLKMFPLNLQLFGEEPEVEDDKETKDVTLDLETIKKQIQDNSDREIKLLKEKQEAEMRAMREQLEALKTATMTDKQKEEETRLLKEKAEQDEKQKILDEMEQLRRERAKDKLDKAIIQRIAKDSYLKGHIEHVASEDELNALIKREGETWKKLYEYENGQKRNRNVTGGYNTKVDNSASFNDKVQSAKDMVKKFLPKQRIAK